MFIVFWIGVFLGLRDSFPFLHFFKVYCLGLFSWVKVEIDYTGAQAGPLRGDHGNGLV